MNNKPLFFISDSNDPYYNISLEYYLTKQAKDFTGLLLWINNPVVVFGHNQNVYEQVDLELMKKEGVLPARRFSGGGAVYQDLGNINYSFFSSTKDYDQKRFKTIVINSLQDLGINAYFNGRNDILVEDKKISGTAYFEEDGQSLYHGTLLYDVDMNKLSKVLTPSKLKLETKGIKSVKSRVINLKDLYPNLTLNLIKDSFMKNYFKEFGVLEDDVLFMKTNTPTLEKNDIYLKLKSPEWIFGEEPQFNVHLEKKFDQGLMSIYLIIKDGKIHEINIYSDSLLDIDFSKIKDDLVGKWFSEDIVYNTIEDILK